MVRDVFLAATPFANLITAIATVVLALLTATLWLENRRLRKVGTAPNVVAYLSPVPDGNGGIDFVLANVGQGPAFDLEFSLIYDADDFEKHRALLTNDPDRTPLSVLPQNEHIRALIGVSFELYGAIGAEHIAPLLPFEVELKYRNSFGRKISGRSRIDIRQFAGLRGIVTQSNNAKAIKSFEKIEKHLGVMARKSQEFFALVDTSQISDAIRNFAKGNDESGSQF